MGKILLKLYQEKKWEKIPFVSDDEIEQYEKYIYNDLNLKEHLDKHDEKYSVEWMNDILKEDEMVVFFPSPIDNYVLTSFGRIFNVERKKSIKLNLSGNLFSITIKGKTINVKKYFIDNGWIYSGSLIRQKHDQYGWLYCEVFPTYKKKK